MLGGASYDRIKRALDAVVGACGLFATLPIQGFIGVAVLIAHGRPVLFRQDRPGLHGEVFTLVKFRTMRHPSYDGEPDDARLTKLGRFLRSTSLDELPSLWNVVKGDMSLVGPRPLLVKYLSRYSPQQMRRHEVRPGLTGLAQVNGRNGLSWDEKFAFDIHYVDNRSFRLDLTILKMTTLSVLRREGISQAGHATMSEFGGGSLSEAGARRD